MRGPEGEVGGRGRVAAAEAAPHLMPLVTGSASCSVRWSSLYRSSSRTDGHRIARPIRGVTVMLSRLRVASGTPSVFDEGPRRAAEATARSRAAQDALRGP